MDRVLKDQIKMDQMDLVLKDQIKMDQMDLVLKDRIKTDQMGLVRKDQTKTDLDQIMARVQIMMLDLRDLIQMGLVLKMETTHKKKTSKLRGLFFMRP